MHRLLSRNQSQNQKVFLTFYSHKIHLLAVLDLFCIPQWQISLPFIFQLVKTLPFHMGPPAPTQSGSLIYLKPEKKKKTYPSPPRSTSPWLSFISITWNWILNVLHDSFLSFCIFCFSVSPTDGKCSNNPVEVARETGKSVLERSNEVKNTVQERVREQVSERGREARERTEEVREKLTTGWW